MADQLLDDLNSQQRKAAANIEGPLLLIAGAGSGKTRVITSRISYMIEQGVKPLNILALTFTNKAAREMEQRVRNTCDRDARGLTISTFHSFGVKLLKSHITTLGYKQHFSIYDQTDKDSLIKDIAYEMSMVLNGWELFEVSNLFSKIKTFRETWAEKGTEFQPLYNEYQERLKLHNAVDFDDLIVMPLGIFNNDAEILVKTQKRYQYIMIDEFQDTSAAQYRLMRAIAEGSRNICVVGDDDQSIYSWRGANYENIVQFEKDFPELTEIKLEQNYRSTGNILKAANALIAHNENRKTKSLWTPMVDGNQIEVLYPENEKEEAEIIADTIKSIAMKEHLPYDSFGILVRTNGLTRPIEEALLGNNIPYKVTGGTSFYQRKEIKDVIAYLKIMVNPADDINLIRILNTPRRGIGKKLLEKIVAVARSKNYSLYTAIHAALHAGDSPLKEKEKQTLLIFMDTIEGYTEKLKVKKGKSKIIEDLVEYIDYWGYLVTDNPNSPKAAEWKYKNIKLFLKSIDIWEKNPDNLETGLREFLNRITLVNKEDDADDAKGRVNLMTIHASKGLEFDHVFLAGVEDEIIPHKRSIDEDAKNLEEERRLFYVAITRARKHIYISTCAERSSMGGTRECRPSPFLEEIPTDLFIDHVEDEAVEEQDAVDYFSRMKEKFSVE